MRLLADQSIPLVEYFFADRVDQITLLPAGDINARAVSQADVLLARSTLQVNEALLAGTSLQFIASCVAGREHLDEAYLQAEGIPYFCASGCNASAVAAYVERVLALLLQHGKLTLGSRVAVVGVGHVGKQVVKVFERAGFTVLQCDPLRAGIDPEFTHTDFEVLNDVALVSLHTPLTVDGPAPTFHMVTQSWLQQLPPESVIIHAGRGEVVAGDACCQPGHTWCVDVWANEPQVWAEQVQQAWLATPHIAGHTVFGKANGTLLAYQAMAEHFDWPDKALPKVAQQNTHHDLVALSNKFKSDPGEFTKLRQGYLQG